MIKNPTSQPSSYVWKEPIVGSRNFKRFSRFCLKVQNYDVQDQQHQKSDQGQVIFRVSLAFFYGII